MDGIGIVVRVVILFIFFCIPPSIVPTNTFSFRWVAIRGQLIYGCLYVRKVLYVVSQMALYMSYCRASHSHLSLHRLSHRLKNPNRCFIQRLDEL